MMKKLTSNEVLADFNYSNINKDFFFFQVETSDKYIKGGATFLDLDELSFVRSIVYERGTCFYIMTMSGQISRSGMTTALNQYEDGDSLSVVQLKAEKLKHYILLQLFLNSISNPEDEMCSYNNISGKLLCYKPAWLEKDNGGILWGLNCLELRIDSNMCIHISAHKMTSLRLKGKMKFEKRKIYEYPQYEFSYNNHTLKRATGEKLNDKDNLIQKPVEGNRGGVTFFDFSDYETFTCTKNGVLFDVFKLMNQQLFHYLQLEFKTYNIDECLSYNRNALEKYKSVVSEQLLSTGVSVIDDVKSSTSELYLQELCDEITKAIPGIKCSIGKRLSKGKVNIRYIHDKSFYSENDPHQDDVKEYVVQHITVENFNHRTRAAVSNILKELVIKKDLRDGCLNIINWADFGYESDWIFGTIIDREYYFMTIHPDGGFDIQKMKRDLFNMTEYDSYMDYFGIYDDKTGNHRDVIGLIKDSKGNINIIKDTDMFTFPNFDEVGNILKNVSEKAVFKGKELIIHLRETMSACENAKVKAELDIVIPSIDENAEYDKISIMNFFKGLNTKKAVVKNIYDNTGVMLYAYLRGEDARSKYLSGTIDINYFEMSDKKARFCVGEIGSGMKYTMERASVIREVEAVDESVLVFKDLLQLMGVEFVRYGMLTVMPFPFKYIREYAAMEIRNE